MKKDPPSYAPIGKGPFWIPLFGRDIGAGNDGGVLVEF